ncbi:MAG: hypothetical protein IPN71_07390 [Fibrobacteres bacterium]|nr:hypothetical protein [Fibrobacterota bacterium]
MKRQILLFGLVVCGLIPQAVQADALEISVPSGGNIQAALDQCPVSDGCVVRLEGGVYTPANSLLLRNKQNIRITGEGAATRPVILFQDDGSLAGPDNNADSLALKPKGWKHWPVAADTLVGGTKNTSNRYSANGFQFNGAFLVQSCTNITLDRLVIDGKEPVGWGSSQLVWASDDPYFFGNVGLNLTFSTNVRVFDSEFRRCFAGVYIKGISSLDSTNPLKSLRSQGGGHFFERNQFHHNIWGVLQEANSGAGLVFRYNKVWHNHNSSATYAKWAKQSTSVPTYDRTNFAGTPKLAANAEAALHYGGFLFFKNLSSLDSIYNNTLWNNHLVVGSDGWLPSKFAFYNNIIASPWMDYNSDTTGLQSTYFNDSKSSGYDYSPRAFAGNMGIGPNTERDSVIYGNTWAIFPVISLMDAKVRTPCSVKDSACKAIRDSLAAKVWDPKRLAVLWISASACSSNVNPEFRTSYPGLLDDVYPQKPGWQVLVNGVNYTRSLPRNAEFDWKYEPPTTVPLSVDGSICTRFGSRLLDTAYLARVYGGIHGQPLKDTLGRILSFGNSSGTSYKDSLFKNHYIKSIPFILDTASPYFLSPIWSDKGVDSVIRGKAWAPAGQKVPAARGAVMPEDVPAGIQALPRRALVKATVALGRDGHLEFSNLGMDGICQIVSVNGRMLAVMEVKAGRTVRALEHRGVVFVRWSVEGGWHMGRVFRP